MEQIKSVKGIEKILNAHFISVQIGVVKASQNLHIFWAKSNTLHRFDIRVPGGSLYTVDTKTINTIKNEIAKTL